MKDTLREIRAATIREPNISAVVNAGLERLDTSLDVVQFMSCLWRVSVQRNQ